MASKQYEPPLVLTTPHMTGIPVRDAQWLMAGNTRFGPELAPYKDGEIDSDYGPLTAQATARTKFWVGYPQSSCDGVFGQTLYEYIRPEKWRPLPKEYAARRKQRLAAAAETPGMKAFKLAVGELGYVETPVNRTKYGIDYGFNGVPWCAIFESWCFTHSGYPRFRYAAVEMIYLDARAARNGLRIVRTPQRGDLGLYSHAGSRYAHTSFYDHPIDGASFADLGGNTGQANFSNGGQVARGVRSMGQVLAFVRVG
jgi:hypothetical protein